MSNLAIVFPGQGSQVVGMGKDLNDNYEIAQKVFNKFDEILDKPLSKICFEGPEEDLKLTINTQPAILAVSIAAFEVLKSKCPINFNYTAGHSLGEYAALYASNVIDLETSIKLVKRRAELMSSAPGGSMLAVLNFDLSKIESIIKEASATGIITIANYNTPEQVVISGEKKAVDLAMTLLKEAGARKIIPLQVSGAFHSLLMKEPANEFNNEVLKYNFNKANKPVITNIDAKATNEGFDQKLVKQIYSSVLWTQTMELLKSSDVDTIIEFGPGKVLAGMFKKYDRSFNVYNVADISTLETTISSLKTKISV